MAHEELTAYSPLIEPLFEPALDPHVEPVAPGAAYRATVAAALRGRRRTLVAALDDMGAQAGVLAQAAERMVQALRAGHKILAAGNGGSAAEAQHFVAELVGRFKRERQPLAAITLSTDTSILTAVANDYGYADVFARQVRALGQAGDVFVAFSTSGESENLVRAARAARERGLVVIAVTGERHSRMERLATLAVRVPVSETPVAQELHMMVTHILCDITEVELMAVPTDGSATA